MEVTQRDAMKLILRSSRARKARLALALSLGGVVVSLSSYFMVTLFGREFKGPDNCVVLFVFAAAGIGIASIIILPSALLKSYDNPIETCILDKESGRVTIFERDRWRFWLSRTEECVLQDISAVALGRSDKDYWLELRLGGKVIRLETMPTAEEGNVSKVADLVSDFLKIPLHISLGSQRVTKYPVLSQGAEISPANCYGCGGSLPPIRQGMDHITCDYCGMTMRVEWADKSCSVIAPGSVADSGGRN